MKKCPFCAEEIQDDARKCRFCGEFLEKLPQGQWYFRASTMIVAFLVAGPFALPLIWFHPRLSSGAKIVITIIVAVASYFLGVLFFGSLSAIDKYYKQVF